MKNGFTLIEMLVSTVIFGLFIIISYPIFNNLTSNFNLINQSQINTLNNLRFYNKINQISENYSDIYYDNTNGLVITIDDNKIKFDDALYINDVFYEVILDDYIVYEKFIILNCNYNDENIKFILRGNVYEINWSKNI